MPHYRSCKNCPVYKWKHCSDAPDYCALRFRIEVTVNDDGTSSAKPLEDCLKPKNIHEMFLAARDRGIELSNADAIDIGRYEHYTKLKKMVNTGDAEAVALANFLFREVIESAHTEYEIPQEEMMAMCKEAVNRAAFYRQMMSGKGQFSEYSENELEKIRKIFVGIESLLGLNWDDAEWTDELETLKSELVYMSIVEGNDHSTNEDNPKADPNPANKYAYIRGAEYYAKVCNKM